MPTGPRFRVPTGKFLNEKNVLEEVIIGRNKIDPSKLVACVPDVCLVNPDPKPEMNETGSCDKKEKEEMMVLDQQQHQEQQPQQETDENKNWKQRIRGASMLRNQEQIDLTITTTTATPAALPKEPTAKFIPRVAMKFASNQRPLNHISDLMKRRQMDIPVGTCRIIVFSNSRGQSSTSATSSTCGSSSSTSSPDSISLLETNNNNVFWKSPKLRDDLKSGGSLLDQLIPIKDDLNSFLLCSKDKKKILKLEKSRKRTKELLNEVRVF